MIRLRIGLSLAWLAALLVLGAAAPLRAEEATKVDWELAPLPEPGVGLFTLSSGALFVRTTSSLLRSDDGATWTQLLAHKGGGGMMEPDAPNVTIGGLAYDPARPERVYVALNVSQRASPRMGGVKLSTDAGQTWSDLGRQDFGPLNDPALGIDGRMLFATTDQGFGRLILP